MEQATLYLYTLAAVSITFVGFAGLFLAFRQAVAVKTTKFDILLTRNHFLLSFMVVGASLLPPLLALFPFLSDEIIWVASSIIAAIPPLVFSIRYPARRYAATGVRMPTGTRVVLFFFYVVAAILLVNAIRSSPGPDLYALGVTVQQLTNIFAFIYALRFVLEEPMVPLSQQPQQRDRKSVV